MKISVIKGCRWLSTGFIAVFLVSCGGDKNDPKVITRNDLKSPGSLSIVDLGNGKVRLQWYTANYEKDFEGYNVYGAKGTAAELTGSSDGQPLELLSNTGDAIEGAKTILNKFTYDAANSNALPGTDALADAKKPEEGELKFSALPYHRLRTATKEPNLPTCRPKSDGTCEFTGTTANPSPDTPVTSVGMTSFDVPETLTVGQSYCFFVFSVQDEGKEISQSSTNVACVVPKYKVTGSFEALTFDTTVKGSKFNIDNTATLKAIRDKCASASGCPTLAFANNASTIGAATSDTTVQFENYGTDANRLFLVSGKSASILSLGFFPDGFSSSTFINQVSEVPKLSLAGTVKNDGGYSLEGQSISLKNNNIYVIASTDPSTASPTSFYYDWLYVTNAECASRVCKVAFDLYLSAQPDVRTR